MILRLWVEVGEVCAPGPCDLVAAREFIAKRRPQSDGGYIGRFKSFRCTHCNAALHALERWILAQARESCCCHSPKLFRLQLHSDSSYTAQVPSDGRRRNRLALER